MLSLSLDSQATPTAHVAFSKIANSADVWQQAAQWLTQQLSPACFQTWLSSVGITFSILSDSALHVTLTTDSRFKRDWIAKHYHALIQQAFGQATPASFTDIQLSIEADEQHHADPVAVSTPQGSLHTTSQPLPASQVSGTTACTANSGLDQQHQQPTPTWQPRTRNGLNPKFCANQLITGEFNHFAKAAAMMVARQPGQQYSPLVITGDVGSGKTHLIQAIGHAIHEQHPSVKVCYVNAEKFTNDLISTVRQNQWHQFRDKYRHVDVLLFDDVHFLANKERTQQELLHTLTTLMEQGKQIVFTGNQPVEQMDNLSEAIKSRCESGLTVHLNAPDYEARRAIIAQKAERDAMPLSEPIADLIAERFHKNIRALEGAINKITAYQCLTQQTVTLDKACQILGQGVNPQVLSAEDIIERVARYYHLDVDTLKGKSRKKNIALARQVSVSLIRELTHASFPVIGQVMGNRSHATIVHACQRIQRDAASNPTLAKQITELRAFLREPASFRQLG